MHAFNIIFLSNATLINCVSVCVCDTVQAVNKHAGVTFVNSIWSNIIIKILHASTLFGCTSRAYAVVHTATGSTKLLKRRGRVKTKLFISKVRMGSTLVAC